MPGKYTVGYKYVIDMDLEKYFDTVNQSKQILFLRAEVLVGGTFEDSLTGVPQDGTKFNVADGYYFKRAIQGKVTYPI